MLENFQLMHGRGKALHVLLQVEHLILMILATFPQGPVMGIGEKCGPVGINVQSSAGGGTAWLSPNGEKHPYSNFIAEK